MKHGHSDEYLSKINLKALTINQFANELNQYLEKEISPNQINSIDLDCPYEDADIFRQGSCQIFAYALHEEFGYKVYKIQVGKSFHIFCKSDDESKYIDVRGITSDFNTFITGSDVSNVEQDVSKEYKFEEDDFTCEFADIALAFAKSIIKKGRERYKL